VTDTRFSLAELSTLFTDIGKRLIAEDNPTEAIELLTRLAAERVPGAEYAGITVGRQGRTFTTIAATDEIVHLTDAIQYELGTGPCVDAIVEDTTFNAGDLLTDPRWPEFGRRAAEATGIRSMLAMRLYFETDQGLIAGLNLYSREPDSFDESSETFATLLATHGSLAVANASASEKARNLVKALDNSREIGVAMGIVMAQHKVTREQAFDLIRIVSQHTHRKVAALATEVADTGVLPPLPSARPEPAAASEAS
jgi:GAF domain-containing protein